MAITNGNRKILDLKRWEMCSYNPQGNTQNGSFISSSRLYRQHQYMAISSNQMLVYDPNEDGWMYLPNPSFGGSFGNGICGATHSWSTGRNVGVSALSAIEGTVSSIKTDQFLTRDLSGYQMTLMEGPQAGSILTIIGNTVEPSSTIYVSAQNTPFDSTTRFRLVTPRWYVLMAGTIGSTSFKCYDYATNSWLSLGVTGFPASIGTDARMVATPSIIEWGDSYFHTFQVSSATSDSIVDGNANWANNQWANSQIRITSGTGAGQIVPILSSTSNSLIISGTWATTPSTDSQIYIEGNDDNLYYFGNANVAIYKYSISKNIWSLVTPTVPRAGAPNTGLGAHWIWEHPDPEWNNSNSIKNGRYIYSFRGGGTATLDIYDIAANSWESNVIYSPGFGGTVSGTADTFSTGAKYVYAKEYMYIMRDNTSRWVRYDIKKRQMDPWNTLTYPSGGTVYGDTAFDVIFKEGNTELRYIYVQLNGSNILMRCLII